MGNTSKKIFTLVIIQFSNASFQGPVLLRRTASLVNPNISEVKYNK